MTSPITAMSYIEEEEPRKVTFDIEEGVVEEEDDGWMDVYNRPAPFQMFIHQDIAHLSTGIFYQTYGGGLEGGFVKMPDGTLHEVERTWGTPFTIKKTILPNSHTWESRPADHINGREYFQIKITTT